MVRVFRVPILLLCFRVLTAAAIAQEIPNWPAPATWFPHGIDRGVSTMSVITSPLPFIGVTPCRLADTRGNGFSGQYGPPSLAANATRSFTIGGQCSIPSFAAAVSFNFTALNVGGDGDLRVFPAGGAVPLVSTLNYNANTPNIANAAVVPLSAAGAITVQADAVPIDLIIDVNGYYGGAAAVSNTNTFLGSLSGNATMTADQNTGVGFGTLTANTSGFGNTAIGGGALNENVGGSYNTSVGGASLNQNTSGSYNTAVGTLALEVNGGGSNNTAVGDSALRNLGSGTGNIAVGAGACSNNLSGNDNICIHSDGVDGESNTIRIGRFFHTGAYIFGISGTGVTGATVLVTSAGRLGVVPSSRSVKEDIRDMARESDDLMRLRPVAFRYKREIDPDGLTQYGLIAEEVADVYPELVIQDRDGRPQTVRYHLLIPMLLNELQKQYRTSEAQQTEIRELEARLARLETRLSTEPPPR